MAIRVTGAAEIALIAAACRKLGTDRSIVNDMAKEITKAIPPIRKAIRVRAVAILPHRGGFGSWVAKARIQSTVRRAPTSAGVKIRGYRHGFPDKNPRTDLAKLDLGSARHLTYGHLPYSLQAVRPGFFTEAVTKEGYDQLERAVLVAAEHAAERIVHA